MNNGRRMLVAALGTMTSAFVVAGQAEARSVESGVIAPAQSGAIIALDQEELKRALLELSPAEKLRIAGDRIRLAAKAKVSTQSSVRGVPPLAQPRKDPFPLSYGCRTYAMCARAPRKAR